jgi:hypothetical protein
MRSPGRLGSVLAVALLTGCAHTAAHVRPALTPSETRFGFELKFVTKGGLDKQAMAAGGIVKDRLYLILYSGAAVHYYAKYRDDAERIIRSVRLK